MSQEQVPPTGQATRDERPPKGDERVYDSDLAMPQEDDPAGDGHMFTPGPDWPPRPDDPAGESGTASSPSHSPAGADQPRTSGDPESADGIRNDLFEASEPRDKP